jgi:hypothetical protein
MSEVQMKMTLQQAEEYRDRMADLLCWLSGFCAAREGTSLAEDMPMGIAEARDLNIRIKRAIDDAMLEARK